MQGNPVIHVQASLYPLESRDADAVINRSIQVLKDQGVRCHVGPVSTEFSGDPDLVWQSLRAAYEAALAEGGEVAMSVTITNSQV